MPAIQPILGRFSWQDFRAICFSVYIYIYLVYIYILHIYILQSVQELRSLSPTLSFTRSLVFLCFKLFIWVRQLDLWIMKLVYIFYALSSINLHNYIHTLESSLRKLYFYFLSNWMGYEFESNFGSILNRMEIHLDQNRKGNCHHDYIPFNLKAIGNIVFSV